MTQLPPVTKKAFDTFVILANKQSEHPLDWDRFYLFVRATHRNHVRLRPSELKLLLVTSGFDRDYSEELMRVYEHGRLILGSDEAYLRGTETWRSRARREADAHRNREPTG